MRDYILALRQGQEAEVQSLLRRLCWFFMGFEAHQYTQCLLINELHMEYLRRCNHPSYSQMLRNIRTHNEERGEMTLSLLAFSVAADTDKHAVTKLDANYSILNFSRQLVKDYDKEHKILPPTPHALNVQTHTRERAGIATAVLDTIQKMQSGTWRSLKPTTVYAYEQGGQRMEVSFPRFLRRNIKNEVRVELSKFKQLLVENNYSFNGLGDAVEPVERDRLEDED